jgi:hypothetical protein
MHPTEIYVYAISLAFEIVDDFFCMGLNFLRTKIDDLI